MKVVNGSRCELTRWTHLNVEIQGITRNVWAFVCPTGNKKLELLLGMPYLESVDAQIDIRKSKIRIGDRDRGETPVHVTAPKCTPVSPMVDKVEVEEESDSSDESSEEEDSEEESDNNAATHQPQSAARRQPYVEDQEEDDDDSDVEDESSEEEDEEEDPQPYAGKGKGRQRDFQ